MAASDVTTTKYPFYQSGESTIFSVMEGIPIDDALNHVSCLLDVARASAYGAEDEAVLLHSAGFHIEAAKAVVDSILKGIMKEKNAHKE